MEVREIDISSIRVSELNVRKDLEAGTEDTDIGDLAKSIADQGLLSPIIVVKLPELLFIWTIATPEPLVVC